MVSSVPDCPMGLRNCGKASGSLDKIPLGVPQGQEQFFQAEPRLFHSLSHTLLIYYNIMDKLKN